MLTHHGGCIITTINILQLAITQESPLNDWNKLSETKRQQENAKIEEGPGLWAYALGIAAILAFYWAFDNFLPFGRRWDNFDYGMAAVAVMVGPLLWRTLSRREKARVLRDERAIRIEIMLDRLLEVQKTDSQDLLERIGEVFDEVHEAPTYKDRKPRLPK
jgi:hypothetical protein